MDQPFQPEFPSWRSYDDFARAVRHKRRYMHSQDVSEFLRTVSATSHKRETTIRAGKVFFRAQRGIEWLEDEERLVSEPSGYHASRMKPLADRATEGRANPSGIPVLYLGSSLETAISEVRPWIGANVSVGRFRVNRDLRAINLTQGHGSSSLHVIRLDHLFEEADPETRERAVWTDIDAAFSRPVTLSDNAADYVPTQILAELFRENGFDAIVYRSQFGESGYNVALFDVSHADIISCTPYTVKKVSITAEEMGNTWFRDPSRE